MLARGALRENAGLWELSLALPVALAAIPESLQQMVETQAVRLTGQERQALEAASLLGIEFDTGDLAAMLETCLTQVEDCCEGLARRGQFLFSTSAGYRFIHELHQRALYRALAAGRRMRWQSRIDHLRGHLFAGLAAFPRMSQTVTAM